MTAEEYTTAFEAISGKTGFNDEALMDACEHGLLCSLVRKIHLDTLPLLLQEWKDKATHIDKLWHCFNEQHSCQGDTAVKATNRKREEID